MPAVLIDLVLPDKITSGAFKWTLLSLPQAEAAIDVNERSMYDRFDCTRACTEPDYEYVPTNITNIGYTCVSEAAALDVNGACTGSDNV